MLRSLKTVHGYAVKATDGNIGKVHDFFFDDEFWLVRYLVVDAGGWLTARKVLITPGVVVGTPDWASQTLSVALTRQQVGKSPDIDTDRPVSQQQETLLRQHYGWPFYWMPGSSAVPAAVPAPPPHDAVQRPGRDAKREGDPHLRSVREVTGYHIQASDGRIGHVEDFVAEDDVWEIRYLVVDTRNWLPGRKVLISPQWLVGPIDWAERTVKVFMTKLQIENSPLFDPEAPVNREYEVRLYDFYGRPGYWLRPQETLEKQ